MGTDIFHAAVLLYVAGAAHWAAGNIDFGILFWLLLGSIPGVLIGGRLTLSIPEQSLRLLLAGVLGLAGIKLLDVPFAGTIVVVRPRGGRRRPPRVDRPAQLDPHPARPERPAAASDRLTRLAGSIAAAMRTVWVSFDTIGRDCLEAAADAGAEIVGVVTLPGPIDPDRSGQCSFDEVAPGSAPRSSRRATSTRDETTLNAVRALEPELVFVVGWSQLVREPFIALAREGVFGMHPTLLPRHRGRAPIPWAILSGLARTGVTLFEIVDSTADSGAIVGQAVVDIAPDETATTLFDRLAGGARRARARVRAAARRPDRASRPAGPGRASAWPKRAPADGIIDWETRAPYLYDWVRAQTRPYPGAFTFLGDEKVVVWRARPVELAEAAPAGTVVAALPDGPVVACGEGGLLLEEVETRAELAVGTGLG